MYTHTHTHTFSLSLSKFEFSKNNRFKSHWGPQRQMQFSGW